MQASDMVAQAVERYGGRSRWEHLRLTVSPRHLRGLLPWLKGNGRTFAFPPRAEVIPARAEATFFDYPTPGSIGRFCRGMVAIEDDPLIEHRASFRGWGKLRRWTPLDALYFFGYALTHYHSLPFTLLEAEVLRTDLRRRSVTVAFPTSVHTHCRVQTIFFAADGLIRRHDYVADIVGPWARGAHFWGAYRDVSGFPLATHRRVLARIGLVTPIVALEARLEDAAIAFDEKGAHGGVPGNYLSSRRIGGIVEK